MQHWEVKQINGGFVMASGKKNYFRHSFNAHNNDKLVMAMELLGPGAYYYYFSLIELCAEKIWSQDLDTNACTFHLQSLRILWKKQTKSCKKVIEKLQESGLFVATFNESFVEFDIPNLLKYLGKYKTKCAPNTSNKSKVNESKEKESKVNEFGAMIVDPFALCQKFFEITGKKTPPTISGDHFTNLKNACTFAPYDSIDSWVEAFKQAANSDYLMEKAWFNIYWIVKYENISKVAIGTYANENGKIKGPTVDEILNGDD